MPPKKVKVTFNTNPNGTYKLNVTPFDLWVNRPSGETASFTCKDAKITVNFDKGDPSPFDVGQFANDPENGSDDSATGTPQANTGMFPAGAYKYSITVEPSDPAKQNLPIGDGTYGYVKKIVIDPAIIIDDSPHPGGSRKRPRGGKKKAVRRGGSKKRATRRKR